MSVYPPPSFTEYIPIFNPIDWEATIDEGITIDYLNTNYLKYPVAQGLETLDGIVNLGDTTLATNLFMSGVDGVNYIQFPNGSKQYVASSASTTPTLTEVLTAGNDGSNLSITGINDIALTTINGSAYPPVVAVDTLSAVLTAGNNAGATSINMNNNAITAVSSLGFATTSQTSAYTGAGALSGSYTSSNITIDTDGKITSIANGSSGSPTTFVSTASTTGYNSGGNYTYWYFTSYPTWVAYSWVFNTPTASRTNVAKTNLGSTPPMNVGTIGTNGSFIFMTGTGISQGYTATSSTMITYCNGFQETYTITAGATSAQLSLINCIGATPASPFFQSNQLGETEATCPPSATALSGYIVLQALNGNYTGLGTPTLTFTQIIA